MNRPYSGTYCNKAFTVRGFVGQHNMRALNARADGVAHLRDSRELYVLPADWSYDPNCLGYMAGWFDRDRARIAGGYFV